LIFNNVKSIKFCLSQHPPHFLLLFKEAKY
jgi:hypothetical protein